MASAQPPRSGAFCLYYHEQTKYSPESLSRKTRQLDWSTQPVPFKEYAGGEVIDLRPYLPGQGQADDANLSRLSLQLYLSYGVTAVVPYPDQPFYMRAAPSAGGLYPAEIYLVSGGGTLSAGLYNYQVRTHTLVRFWSGECWQRLVRDCFDDPAFAEQDLAVVVTAVFERSAWRYEDRAYRRVFLDSGHLLGNLELATALGGQHLGLITAFDDDALATLLFLVPDEEGVVAVGIPGQAAMPGHATALPGRRVVDYPPVPEGQLLTYLHRASKLSDPSSQPPLTVEDKYNFPFCLRVTTRTSPLDWRGKLASTILERRSTRSYSGEDVTLDQLKLLLDFTYHPEHYAEQGFDPAPEYAHLHLLSTFVAALGVEGLEEGCYYYAPGAEELRQIRFKNFRQQIHHLCLGQELGRDSAAVVFHTADLPAAAALYGERVYRTLHLDSGHLAQRLNLAAIFLGLGVSGIAGFFDDQVNEVLGIPAQEAVLYLTTLGKPRRGSRP
jgi:SagB-type dehydrogenase family enzyme